MLLWFPDLPREAAALVQLFLDVATLAKANVAATTFLHAEAQAHVYELLTKTPEVLRVAQLPVWQNPALVASPRRRPIVFARNCKLLWRQALQPLQRLGGHHVACPGMIEQNHVQVQILGVQKVDDLSSANLQALLGACPESAELDVDDSACRSGRGCNIPHQIRCLNHESELVGRAMQILQHGRWRYRYFPVADALTNQSSLLEFNISGFCGALIFIDLSDPCAFPWISGARHCLPQACMPDLAENILN